jgi:uncharacterized protein (TIGR03083 family)
MDVVTHIGELRRDGELLAAAAKRGALDAAIPSCPQWQMRDLLRHTSRVHRWAAANIIRASSEPMTEQQRRDAIGPSPDDGTLIEWYRAGHAAIVEVLESADPALRCWTFMPATTSLGFWARRQAHETAIHRVDAELAHGGVTPVPPQFAADGIDELLTAFLPRPATRSLRADPARTLAVHAADVGESWLVRFGPDSTEVFRQDAVADCAIRGAAADLYLLLWNRRAVDGAVNGIVDGAVNGIEVTGDSGLLVQWREQVRIG